MVFSNNLLMGAAGQASGYEIEQSIRFNDDDSAYLSRTLGTASNRKIWTLSWWVKRANLGIRTQMFAIPAASGNQFIIEFDLGDGGAGGNDQLIFNNETSGTTALNWELEIAFRDPAAWYHFVAVYDTTQSTANDRFKCFVNGALQTEWDRNSTPGQNEEQAWNNALEHRIGGKHHANAGYFDGYMTEIHFIDGTAKAASDFGEYNSSGVWVPIEYAGSYGNNGFFIDGRDSSDLGDDESGNGNDFSSSGLAAADQMSDTPTKNWCTLSPIDKFGGTLTLSDGNLRAVPAASAYSNNHGTFYINSGKWVFECKHTTVFGEACGWSPPGEILSGSSDRGYFMMADGRAYDNTTNTGTKGASLASGDFRYVFYDADAQAMWFAHVDVSSSNALVYDNSATKAEIEAGTTTNAVFTSIPAGFWAPGIWMDTSGVIEVNFGQSSFATSSDLPTGFNTLNTANLPTPTISDGSKYFQTTLYTGNGSTQSISQSGENSTFQPDFAWIKGRDSGYDHALYDAVRGATKEIKSNATDAEATITNGVTAFESDGFALGDRVGVNSNTENFVAWQWLAGNSSGSTNDDGSVDSTVTVNTTAGFSICKYNPGGNSNVTFGHGLGVAPRLVLVKNLEDATNWQVLHLDQGVGNKIFLNTTGAASSDANMWQNTAPTSTVVSVGTAQTSNEQCIAYVFAEVEGYSSIGSYEGNGNADGTFVYTGFSPSWLLIKNIDAAESWNLRDSSRDLFNVTKEILAPNTNAAEATSGGGQYADLLSNGFKLRGTDPGVNSAATFIYVAFAEHPFGGGGAAPATAR